MERQLVPPESRLVEERDVDGADDFDRADAEAPAEVVEIVESLPGVEDDATPPVAAVFVEHDGGVEVVLVVGAPLQLETEVDIDAGVRPRRGQKGEQPEEEGGEEASVHGVKESRLGRRARRSR
jgi:hypothetical protein